MVKVGDSATTEIETTVDGVEVTLAVAGVVVKVRRPWIAAPPIFGQRWQPWASKRYSKTAPYTFLQAGCFVCSLASNAVWAGYDTNPEDTARRLDEVAAFATGQWAGNLIAERVPLAFPRLMYSKYVSRYNWEVVSADLEVLGNHLAHYPVVVQVDFVPSTVALDTHFVLAYRYEPDPAGGPNDHLWVMDPWDGAYVDVAENAVYNSAGKRTGGGYFNPTWRLRAGVTRVQRVVTGARIFLIDGGTDD